LLRQLVLCLKLHEIGRTEELRSKESNALRVGGARSRSLCAVVSFLQALQKF
jgi:hypothetical protein